ncbi:hypothetical protein VZC37_15760 [Gordonia sp. LSe1-13]|uniref:Integral membrane protein n=1 Tax=Gordonia sesuvii TaxID=3116777 RepID=A0ABU7MFB8_9ACTN|nr:hypothetical protein [Gordonia sp. LSe1-13]
MPVTTTDSCLEFAFPEVHRQAHLSITVQRTLRVPDDATTYGLPPGLGAFQLTDGAQVRNRARDWSSGDVLLPMWQAEAAWFSFSALSDYPFLVRMSVGGINAVTGDDFTDEVDFTGEDYFEVPTQPWLDGFRVDETTVRQFVAMPLGKGYTAAEQLTGDDDATLRIQVTPLKGETWDGRQAARRARRRKVADFGDIVAPLAAPDGAMPEPGSAMGMGAGGSITQSIAVPIEQKENWVIDAQSEATLRIINSAQWEALTDTPPHHAPPTITQYRRYGYPWFEWYDDSLARQGSSKFADLDTVKQVGEKNGEQALPDNPSFLPPAPHIVGG